MNHEESERAKLENSFRLTLDLMQRMGVPRELLLDVVESLVIELRGVRQSQPHAAARSHIELQLDTIDPSDPFVAENVRRTSETAERLDVILKEAAMKYDIFVSISACITELAAMLRAVKESSGGEDAVQIALDGLQKCVASGEETISSPIFLHSKH